jgi:hypothetical protein
MTVRLALSAMTLVTNLAYGADPEPRKQPAKAETVKAATSQQNAQRAPALQPDIKFLEYLGTVETDDENWTEIAAAALAAPRGSGKAPQPKSVTEPKL